MRLGFLGVGKEASGLDDDLGADAGPIQLGGVALSEYFDFFAVNRDGVGVEGALIFEIAEDRVGFEQVSEGGGGSEVVDGYEFDVWIADCAAEDVTSDAAEAVDTYLYCHDDDCSCP